MKNNLIWNFKQPRTASTVLEPPDPPDPPAGINRLYLLGGQSNQDGRGTISELPPEMTGQFPRAYVWVNPGNFWAKIEPGVYNGTLNGVTSRVGPLIPLAYYEQIKHPLDNLYFVIYAQGGTDMSNEWLPPSGTCYTKLTSTRYDAAMTAASGLGITFDTKEGFIWYQGESDSQTVPLSSAYYANEYTMVNAVFSHTGFTKLFDVKVSTSYTYNSVVNQAKIDNALRIDSELIETADINPDSDLHLSTAGYILLGERISGAI